MSYKLGKRSMARLCMEVGGVSLHPDMKKVVLRAIEITKQDFTILEVVRTEEQQRQKVLSGASRTMDSRHLTGHAVDLGAWTGNSVSWDFGLYYSVAEAMRDAAAEYDIPIVWGACWTVINHEEDLGTAVAEYAARKRAQGRKPLLDGPHFHLYRGSYPDDAGDDREEDEDEPGDFLSSLFG